MSTTMDHRIRLGGQPSFHRGEFGTVEVELAQQGTHGPPLLGRRCLMLQPGPAAGAEEVGHRRSGQHVAVQHRLGLVL
ncbi:hypothetical protein [Streptomyces sp. NPDC002540]